MRRRTPKKETDREASTPTRRGTRAAPTNVVGDLQQSVGNQAVHRLLESGAAQAKLRVSHPGDADEIQADRVAEQVVGSSNPGTLPRKCACPGSGPCPECDEEESKGIHRKAAPSIGYGASVDTAMRLGGGDALEPALRRSMETSFGHDLSGVRIHTDSRAAESACGVDARAYTHGRDIVFGAGEYSPDSSSGRRLLAHELAHVVQQSRGRGTRAGIARVPKDPPMYPRHARGHVGEQGMGFEMYPASEGWIFFEGPSGAAGHGVTTKSFDGVAYNTKTDVLHLIDNKSLKSPGNVGSATAIDPAKNLAKNVDALIGRVEAAKDVPGRTRVLALLKQTRAALAAKQPLPSNVRLVVTGAGGQSTGVTPRLEEAGVEFRPGGSSKAPPKGAPPVETPPTKAPTPLPETPKVEPPVPAERPATPKGGGKGPGVTGGLLSFAIPLILGWLHQKGVEERTEEKAKTEGHVPHGAPSGEGVLYDIGAWLIDPANDADAAVGIDKRFNFPVWRARIRDAAHAKNTGDTLEMTWDIGRCKVDFLGRQEIEKRKVVYRKQADGSWVVTSGNPAGTPHLNDIISAKVSDEALKGLIMRDPCTA